MTTLPEKIKEAEETLSLHSQDYWVSSLKVAEKFEKEHQHVLEAFRKLKCSKDFRLSNFRHSTYFNSTGRETPFLEMNSKGFSMLAMGFTGQIAAEWREAYIEAFHKMAAQFVIPPLPVEPPTELEMLLSVVQNAVNAQREIRQLQADNAERKTEIKQIVARLDIQKIDADQRRTLRALLGKLGDRYKQCGHPRPYAEANRAFNRHFGLGGYDGLLQSQFDEAVRWVQVETDKTRPLPMKLAPAREVRR